jgi:outer membrane lipoprotein-sorting protein
MQDQLNNDDLLDQATAALRNTPVVQGPSEDLIAQTLSRLEVESDSDRSTFNWKIFIMKHRPLAAAAVVIIVSATALLIFLQRPDNLAFGQVIEKVRAISAVSFKMRGKVQIPDGALTDMDAQVTVADPFKMREVINSNTTVILDGHAAKELMLNSEKKTALLMDMGKSPIPQAANADVLDNFRKFDPKEFKPIGQKTINNVKVAGFRSEKPNLTQTVWVDPITKLPIQMETKLSGPVAPNVEAVMTDFDWNPEIDETTFSLTTPDGYKTETVSMDMSSLSEQDVVTGLHSFAEFNNDTFPDAFNMMELMHVISKAKSSLLKQQAATDPEVVKQNMMKQFLPITRAMAFTMGPQNGSDWRYAGKGAKLNDANRPVFWYLPKNSQVYHVIDAELKVTEVPADQLPKIPSVSISSPMSIPTSKPAQ